MLLTLGQRQSRSTGLPAPAKAAALQGQVYNPEIGFALVAQCGGGNGKYPYNPFYGASAPCLAAWNPQFENEGMGKIFGDVPPSSAADTAASMAVSTA